MAAAIRLLAVREYARGELCCKLERKGHSSDCANAVLDHLAAEHLQSDERFTEQYVAFRIRRGYGPLRIAAELRDRGVSESLLGDWLDPRDAQWRQQLLTVAAQRFGEQRPSDRRELGRRARFLEYRGFSSEMIRQYLFD